MRDHRLDNAKGILIFLVVLGHCLEAVQGWDNPVLRGLLTAIYMFHMPAFVFLAGITAKHDQLGRRIANLAILLVLFQLAYVVPIMLKNGTSPVGPLQPFWALWFLLSMIWWLALLPLIVRLPFPLLIASAVAVVAGLLPWAGYPLSASRTLVFLPFFVAGHLYGRQLMARTARPALWTLPALLALSAMAVVLYKAEIVHPWLSGYANYAVLQVDGLTGMAIRGGLMLVAAMATVALLIAAPAKMGWFSALGSASMAVFLLHGFAIRAGGSKGLNWVMQNYGTGAVLIAALIFAALVTVALGRSSIDRAIRNLAAWLLAQCMGLRQQVRP